MAKSLNKKLYSLFLLLFGFCLLSLIEPSEAAGAPGDVINCSPPFNISNSPGYASQDPFLLADPAGIVHLFWGERVTGAAGSSTETGQGLPDTIMYATWNGQTWSKAVDIFISPPNYSRSRVAYPRAILDNQGIIHLAWIGPENTFYYSSVHADQAGNARAWRTPLLLASDQTGVEYSFDLTYESPHTLHIIYSKGATGDTRSVAYVRSVDDGITWSEPAELYTVTGPERGTSNLRLLVDLPNKLYATWTEWDETGNGQAIYFARSLDGGNTWDYPVLLAERSGDEYERDWTNPAVLSDNQLIVMWEGGQFAYPQAQYSDDGGVTWSEPIDTFYWLIADNGYASLMRDHTGRLHTFLVRRIRQGNGDRCIFAGCTFAESRGATNTLWHSVWQGARRWEEPQPVGNFGEGYVGENGISDIGGSFTSVVFAGGNQVVTAWFNFTYQELAVMQCELEGVPAIAPQPWPTATPAPTVIPGPTLTSAVTSPGTTPQGTPSIFLADSPPPSTEVSSNPGYPILISIIPSILIFVIIIVIKQHFNH